MLSTCNEFAFNVRTLATAAAADVMGFPADGTFTTGSGKAEASNGVSLLDPEAVLAMLGFFTGACRFARARDDTPATKHAASHVMSLTLILIQLSEMSHGLLSDHRLLE